jgi:hypothetical protein
VAAQISLSYMEFKISPRPDESERAAIEAALEADAAERPERSAWAGAQLSERDGEGEHRP